MAPSTPWFGVGGGAAVFDVPIDDFELVETPKETQQYVSSEPKEASEAMTDDNMANFTMKDIFGANSDDDEDIANLKTFARGEWPGNPEIEADDEGEGFVDTASSNSEDEEESSDEAEEDFYKTQAGVAGDTFEAVIEGNLIQNVKSKYLHRASDDSGTLTKCNLSG